jgi:hypothetical protein
MRFCSVKFSQKRGTSLLPAGQSRLPILKERRTLINNIALVENRCQLLMQNFCINLENADFSGQQYAGKSMMMFQFLENVSAHFWL